MSPKEIKALRENLRVTQAELGSLLGSVQTTISRWETGTWIPGAYQVALLERLKEAPRKKNYSVMLAQKGAISTLASML